LGELVERIAGVEVRVNNLEARFSSHEEKQNGAFKEIKQELKEINKKLNGRPSWPVSIIITLLSSAFVGVLVHSIK
jgi:uncharacterized membrane protein YjjP (DUF1212 family)